MLVGTRATGDSTIGGFRRVVFPFNDPMSGPNICSAASTSAGVTGQFDITFLFSKSTNATVLGRPSIIWSSRALTARK